MRYINNLALKTRKSIIKLIHFIKFSSGKKEIFQNVIGLENIRRVFILTLVAIPTSALYLVIFQIRAGSAAGIEYQWRTAISISHTVLLFSFTIISIVIYFFSYKPRKNNIIAKEMSITTSAVKKLIERICIKVDVPGKKELIECLFIYVYK